MSDAEKRDRLDRLMSLQASISEEINAQFVGRKLRVLVDRASDDPELDAIGRSRMDAPEIDGEVFLTAPAEVGTFVDVEITDALQYDLIGRPAAPAPLLGIAPAREGTERAVESSRFKVENRCHTDVVWLEH